MKKSKPPKLPPPLPPPPTLTDADVEDQRRLQREKERKRRGRSSTILTGPLGAAGQAPVQKKTLLGQ
jgi:hypothetical protein